MFTIEDDTYALSSMAYLVLLGLIVLVNLLPAFAPPTWAVLVFFITKYELSLPLVILCGVTAATLGRWILSSYTGWIADRVFNKEQTENLNYLSTRLGKTHLANFLFTALYCLTPLSSAALFMAAGMMHMHRGVLLAGFFVGRLISYTILVMAADSLATTIRDVTDNGEYNLWGILFSLVAFVVMVLFICIDWRQLLEHRRLRFKWKIFTFQKK